MLTCHVSTKYCDQILSNDGIRIYKYARLKLEKVLLLLRHPQGSSLVNTTELKCFKFILVFKDSQTKNGRTFGLTCTV